MRSLILSVLLAAAALTATTDDSISVSGKWQIQRNAAGRESKQECTIEQSNGGLAGTCTTDKGPVKLTGKVEGKIVTWTYRADSEGGEVTVVYKGVLEAATKITGTVTAVEYGIEGDFTATLSK